MFASIPFFIPKINSSEGTLKNIQKTCMIDLRGSMAYGSTIGDKNTY